MEPQRPDFLFFDNTPGLQSCLGDCRLWQILQNTSVFYQVYLLLTKDTKTYAQIHNSEKRRKDHILL